MERTFAIIKPDAVKARHAGAILSRIEQAGFRIVALRLQHLTKAEAEGFYAVHARGRSSGRSPTSCRRARACCCPSKRPTRSRQWRTLMGATDPAKADAGTLRKDFGQSIEFNATHGSDAAETAAFELGYFFRGMELR